jgi:menaquinone-dependent protoporphyrinogen oxidase
MSDAAPAGTRRKVLRRIGIGIAALIAISGGLIAWGVRRPQPVLVNTACQGSSEMKRKVLIAYATRAGSTAEVAQTISEQLCKAGMQTEVRPVKALRTLEGYDAVILGSAIRYSAWLPEMLAFIQAQQPALARLPVAIFTLHIQALGEDAASRETRGRYTQAARALITPRSEAFFAGKVDPATLSFFERLAVKMVKSPIGDKRDWNQIRSWADELVRSLHSPA